MVHCKFRGNPPPDSEMMSPPLAGIWQGWSAGVKFLPSMVTRKERYAERLEMRRVRETLRYRFEQGLGHKSIAIRVGGAPSTVRETLRRAAVTELLWPLNDDVTDAALEAVLYKAAGTKTGHRRAPACASARDGPVPSPASRTPPVRQVAPPGDPGRCRLSQRAWP